MLISIGIDNGLKGAVVAVNENLELVFWCDCPITQSTTKSKGKSKTHSQFSPVEMRRVLNEIVFDTEEFENHHFMVWLEYAGAMPKQGLASTFKTGRGAGLWEGIVVGMGLKYDIVHPRTWTALVLKDVPKGDPKQRSFIKTQRLFPDLPLTKPGGRVLSMDGRSDAALIAYYGILQMKGLKDDPKKIIKKPVLKKKRVGKW